MTILKHPFIFNIITIDLKFKSQTIKIQFQRNLVYELLNSNQKSFCYDSISFKNIKSKIKQSIIQVYLLFIMIKDIK
jgi:hypothetical protein